MSLCDRQLVARYLSTEVFYFARYGVCTRRGSLPLSRLELAVRRERGVSVDLTDAQEAPSAMTITGSMNEEGLGLVSWWE